MRRLELITAAVLVPLDFVMVVLAGCAAYSLRFSGTVANLRPVVAELPFQEYVVFVFAIAIIWVLCLAMAGLYALRQRYAIAEIGRVIVASAAAMTVVIFSIFFRRELFSSRFIILVGWLLGVLFVAFGRLLVRWIVQVMQRNGVGLQRLLVVGSGDLADRIVNDLYQGRGEGYQCVGRLPDFCSSTQVQFSAVLQEKKPDAVLLAATDVPQADVVALLNAAQQHHLGFQYVADMFATHAGHLRVSTLFGTPVVEVQRTRLDGWGKIWKRTFDILISGLGLIILSPFFLIIALLIVLDSPGPVFAKLKRVGERGKIFTLLKFRSMIRNAHALKPTLMEKNERQDGPLFKMANDPRITRVGRFLRQTSLDEFPQLVNVLLGSMSLVGPRPHEPEEVSKYAGWHRKLLTIRPGMTGMAQVRGRAALSFDEEAQLDITYIENWSFAMDVMILLRTPGAVFSRRAAV